MGRVNGVVLAERMAIPVLGQEQPPEIRVPLEANPEEVIALALHPQGPPVEAGQTGTGRLPADPRLYGDGEPAPPAPEVLKAADHIKPVRLPIHGRQVAEVPATQGVLGEPRELDPTQNRNDDNQVSGIDRTLGVLAGWLDSERLPDPGEGEIEGHGRGQPAMGAGVDRLPVFWNCATFSWSFRIPNMRDSGVGGQPGTYTSTGTTRSTPLTTW